jgi:hypothetical protein
MGYTSLGDNSREPRFERHGEPLPRGQLLGRASLATTETSAPSGLRRSGETRGVGQFLRCRHHVQASARGWSPQLLPSPEPVIGNSSGTASGSFAPTPLSLPLLAPGCDSQFPTEIASAPRGATAIAVITQLEIFFRTSPCIGESAPVAGNRLSCR